jgi:sulfide:quinone oxidoreductase
LGGPVVAEIAILGGGAGGLACAARLRALLPPEHRITVVDAQSAARPGVVCLALLAGWVGEDAARLALPDLEEHGIAYVQARVVRVDADRRCVHLLPAEGSGGRREWQADVLVVALGARYAWEAVPGLAVPGSAHTFYTPEGAVQLRAALADLPAGGRVLVVVPPGPYRCPPAPYEGALLLAALVRPGARVDLAIPDREPLPLLDPAVRAQMTGLLQQAGVGLLCGRVLEEVDPAAGRVRFAGGPSEAYDLLVAVPPHAVPAALVEGGLCPPGGWVQADPRDGRTRWPGVYAVGDAAAVALPGGGVLPKAGAFAQGLGRAAAQSIACALGAAPAEGRYDGRGACWVLGGPDRAGLLSVDLYRPQPPRSVLGELGASGRAALLTELAAWPRALWGPPRP